MSPVGASVIYRSSPVYAAHKRRGLWQHRGWAPPLPSPSPGTSFLLHASPLLRLRTSVSDVSHRSKSNLGRGERVGRVADPLLQSLSPSSVFPPACDLPPPLPTLLWPLLSI